MKPGTSKRMVTLPIGPVCPVCNGDGVVHSERSLCDWEEQTPWFNRETMTPPPPQSWKDRLCQRCCGAGMLNATTGEPLWERLLSTAIPKHVRLLLAAGKRKRGRRVPT